MLLASDARSSERARGLTVGADDIVSEPLDMLELVARIHGSLRRSARQQELARDNMLDPLTML